MREIIIDNITIKIGENAKENTELIKTLKFINENYMWFHLSSFPSPHIIIESEIITENLIVKCAELCRKYSKYKYMRNLYIDYTPLKNIKLTAIPGEVEFISNKMVKKIKLTN